MGDGDRFRGTYGVLAPHNRKMGVLMGYAEGVYLQKNEKKNINHQSFEGWVMNARFALASKKLLIFGSDFVYKT